MNRRAYLRLLGAGLGGASLGETSAHKSVAHVVEEPEKPVSLEDIIVPQSVFHQDLRAADFYTGPTTHLKHEVRRDGELIPLYMFRRTLGFPEMPSSPVEITIRIMQLPAGNSGSYAEELETVFDWAILSCSLGGKLSGRRLFEQIGVGLTENNADANSDAETEVKGHNKRQTVDGVRQFEQWVLRPMEAPRENMDEVDLMSTDAFWETATIVEMTEWGAFEVSVTLEQPSEEAQALQAVRGVAELQRQRVQSSPKPEPWARYGEQW